MNNKAGRFVGCDLLLGGSAAAGIVMGGYSNHADDVGVRGGGTGTILVHISGSATEDNHLENSRLSDFVGTGVAIDHANDTFLTNIIAYGRASNTTSTTLLVDSAAGGVIVDNFVGGNSGLHGFWERYYLGGNYPTFIFANNFECDLAVSDCLLFDSTLGRANVDATFVNSWAPTQIAEARRIAPIVCIQNHYNLAHRADDALIADLARDGAPMCRSFHSAGSPRCSQLRCSMSPRASVPRLYKLRPLGFSRDRRISW
jgi:hypothetical protein